MSRRENISGHELTELLTSARNGTTDSADLLMTAVYDDLRLLALGVMANEGGEHTLEPTAVVTGASLRLFRPGSNSADWQSVEVKWQNRAHFLAVAAGQMRLVLIDYARQRKAAKRGRGLRVCREDAGPLAAADGHDFEHLNELLDLLATKDPAAARTIELKFFRDLTVARRRWFWVSVRPSSAATGNLRACGCEPVYMEPKKFSKIVRLFRICITGVKFMLKAAIKQRAGLYRITVALTCLGALAWAQTKAPATQSPTSPATNAPAKPAIGNASAIDNVIQLVKSGMSESLIIKTLKKQNHPINLTPADLVKLQAAGVSENIINVMEDPTSTPSPNATAATQGAPGPAPPPAVTAAAANSLVAAAKSAPAHAPVTAPTTTPTPVPVNVTKKRVAVNDFDYSAVMTSVQAVFGTNQNIGKGIRAMLTNKLAQQGKVVLVERNNLEKIKVEQDLNASNRVKQGTGARIGRIQGADALLLGDITIFGRDDKKKGIGLGGLGGSWWGGAAAAAAANWKADKAVVAITYRLVDAETSEVIATGEARGESTRKSNSFGAMVAGWNRGTYGAGAGGYDMTSSNFAETIIGEATQDCVNRLADIMNTQADAMKKAAHEVEAAVADVAGNVLTITAGGNDGVVAGDVFEILKVVREVKDPSTNEVLDRITEKIGEMTVVSVRDKIATGNYSGQTAAVAYLARKKM